MLTRILAVREIHREEEAAQHQSSAIADDNSLEWYEALLISTTTFSDAEQFTEN